MKLNNTILALSVPQGLLLLAASLTGLLTKDFYFRETSNWANQSIGQDMINLFVILPVLITTGTISAKSDRFVFPLWAGVNLYLAYSFVIYCFNIHFNSLFLVYCAILGLSFYSLVYYFRTAGNRSLGFTAMKKNAFRVTAVYFLFLSVAFAFLWLSRIIPAIVSGDLPKDMIVAGLVTNPVDVLDLSIVLPAIGYTGIRMLRRKPDTGAVVPVLLMFMILMEITIAGLAIYVNARQADGNYIVALVMALLTLVTIWLAFWYHRATRREI